MNIINDSNVAHEQSKALAELCQMESLHISSMHCTGTTLDEWSDFCGTLRQSKNIKKLRISGNEFTFAAKPGESASRLSMLERNLPTSIQHLDLSNSSASWSKLQVLFRTPLPQLQSLELRNNFITSCALAELADFLRACPELKSINLANNSVGKQGIVHLMNILPTTCPNLQHVDLRGNFGAHHACKEILEWVERSPSIQTFRFDCADDTLYTNKKMLFLLEINRFGRRCIHNYNSVPQALWSTIFGASSPDMVYTALQERPDIVRRG
jgi:Ran GTPase-activating protein (RanGAP) involved in mRNA processing and transport